MLTTIAVSDQIETARAFRARRLIVISAPPVAGRHTWSSEDMAASSDRCLPSSRWRITVIPENGVDACRVNGNERARAGSRKNWRISRGLLSCTPLHDSARECAGGCGGGGLRPWRVRSVRLGACRTARVRSSWGGCTGRADCDPGITEDDADPWYRSHAAPSQAPVVTGGNPGSLAAQGEAASLGAAAFI